MDLQTADGLLHRLSSCCTISGHSAPTEKRDFTIISTESDYNKHTERTMMSCSYIR